MSKKMTISDLQKHIISEVKKLHRIEVLKEEKAMLNKMLNENEESENSSEIINTALKIGPKLMNNPSLLKIADKISKDPKAVSDIKKYVNSINGGINEEAEVDNDFIKKSIEKSIMLSKNIQEDSITKQLVDKDLHIPLHGIAGLVGGYLADKYFDNPIIEKAAYATAEYLKGIGTIYNYHPATSELTYNPNLVIAGGAAVGLIISCIALMVLDKISVKNKNSNFHFSSLFFPRALNKDIEDSIAQAKKTNKK